MAKIQVNNLKVSYGRKPVLNIASLEVATGEIVALYGPNHSGKSTLIKVLAGSHRDLHLQKSASVLYDGKPLEEFGRTKVSYLPQRFSETLFPWMSLQKNLRLRLLAEDGENEKMDKQVEELCKELNFNSEADLCTHFGFLADGEYKRPSHLSGGQQQTLTLLRALVPKPSVLVLDEPFSAIDIYKGATLRRTILNFVEFGRFNGSPGKGVTTVLVTHDLDEAVDLADRVVVLKRDNAGSVVANIYPVGTPKPGPNLDTADATVLVKKIKEENAIGA